MTDLTPCLIEQLAAEIAAKMPRQFPIEVALWDHADIAAYLRRQSPKAVSEHIVNLPGFPQAIRLPTGKQGRGHPLWYAREVIAWVGTHQEKRKA